MTDIHQLYQETLSEILRLCDPVESKKDAPFFPGLIAVNSDGGIIVNEKIERNIVKIADWTQQHRADTKSQYSNKEWRALVRKAFGPFMMEFDAEKSISESAKSLKKYVEEYIDKKSIVIPIKFHTFGCTLFSNEAPSKIEIGPVIFEQKNDWLERCASEGRLKKESAQRISKLLKKGVFENIDSNIDSLEEKSIFDVLNSSQLVCSVETRGLAPETSQFRAITGARIAQAAIALIWPMPSKILSGFSLSVDHGWRYIKTIPYVPGQRMLGGFRMVGAPHGPRIDPLDLQKILNNYSGYFEVCGRAINCWTSKEDFEQLPDVIRRISQSMHFFWEGCRDENALMAIVKFTASLESLYKPKSSGIIALAEARLGKKADDNIAGDRTLRQVVELIYQHGRSRTLHGTNDAILHDWSDVRSLAESLARHCLVSSIDLVECDSSVTDGAALAGQD